MADNNENEEIYSPEEPLNFGPMVNPAATMGVDPAELRRNPALFSKLAGGGVGLPGADSSATPPTAPSIGAPDSGAVPASASRSGKATPDMMQAALKQGIDALTNAPDPNAEMAKEDQLEKQLQQAETQRSQDLRDPQSGKLLPQYKPSFGQRVVRGIQAFGSGKPADYGAPNAAGQQDIIGLKLRNKMLPDGGDFIGSQATHQNI